MRSPDRAPTGRGRAEPARLRLVTADNPGPLTLEGTNSWLVGLAPAGADAEDAADAARPPAAGGGVDGWALIDPGPRDPRHLDAIAAAAGPHPVRVICLTHAHGDHSDAAEAAAERFAAPIAASAATFHHLGLSGIELADGDAADSAAELVALSTPGHSGDHLCYFRPRERALFTGDLVLGAGSSMVAYPDGSVADYLASLARLIELAPDRLYPGHGPVVEDAVDRLREYRDHRLERQRQVEAAVEAGARDVAAIRAAVYGDLPPGLTGAADLSIRAHLAYLDAACG